MNVATGRGDDPERRYTLREWLIDGHTVSSPGAAVYGMADLLGIRIVAQIILVGWRAPHSLEHRVQMRLLPKLKRP